MIKNYQNLLGGSEVGIEWSCQACTYHNDSSSTECSICGTPRIK